METSIMIMSQVVLKEFVSVEKRLPKDDEDMDIMTVAILKTYKSALKAQAKINIFNKTNK